MIHNNLQYSTLKKTTKGHTTSNEDKNKATPKTDRTLQLIYLKVQLNLQRDIVHECHHKPCLYNNIEYDPTEHYVLDRKANFSLN
jgi:hypothetical protein